MLDAFYRLGEDDGWAIASHLAMSTLTSMFPFPDLRHGPRRVHRLLEPRRSRNAADLRRLAAPGRGADRERDPQRPHHPARQPAHHRRLAGRVLLLERRRGVSHRSQPRLWGEGAPDLVAVAPRVDRLRARRGTGSPGPGFSGGAGAADLVGSSGLCARGVRTRGVRHGRPLRPRVGDTHHVARDRPQMVAGREAHLCPDRAGHQP